MKADSFIYRSAACYFLHTGCGLVMVDAGWPDAQAELNSFMVQKGIKYSDIKYLVITHYHPDHAGLVPVLADSGVTLVVHEVQIPFIQKLNEFFKKNIKFNFKGISTKNSVTVSSAGSRDLLKSLGIEGELVETPGHSQDSISLVIDGCCAFTGDLPAYELIKAYNDRIIEQSWDRILGYDVLDIYPAHGVPYQLKQV